MGRARAVVVAGVAGILLAGCTAAPPAKLEPATLDPTAQLELTTTVIEDETGTYACYFNFTSLPPQCSAGFPVIGFDWDAVDEFEENSGVRWGDFDLVATYDGASLRLVGDPVPASPPSSPASEPPAGPLSESRVNEILNELRAELPDLAGSGAGNGYVSITVVYDDGSLQRQLDARYGEGAVVVESLLPGAK